MQDDHNKLDGYAPNAAFTAGRQACANVIGESYVDRALDARRKLAEVLQAHATGS